MSHKKKTEDALAQLSAVKQKKVKRREQMEEELEDEDEDFVPLDLGSSMIQIFICSFTLTQQGKEK
jgi:hypothetical protein